MSEDIGMDKRCRMCLRVLEYRKDDKTRCSSCKEHAEKTALIIAAEEEILRRVSP